MTYVDDRQCRVESGRWWDPYTGAVLTDPGDLDVDHLVPLANAHRSGGWAWSEERKRLFANDLGYGAHLIAVTASANRAKGARGPEEWRPPDQSYWCEYATAWSRVKRAWDLTVTHAEAMALREMLKTCDGPVNFEATGELPVAVPVAPQPPPAVGTYASCDEAEAGGEPRVKGSRGEGWGFPASLLPNSRDGDGDGVVCEVALPLSAQPTAMPLPTPTPTFVPSASPAPVGTYATCDEAEAEGEERIQGSIGGGMGFAAALVPGARDGDGDGIVCEVAGPSLATPTPAPASADATATPTPAAPIDCGPAHRYTVADPYSDAHDGPHCDTHRNADADGNADDDTHRDTNCGTATDGGLRLVRGGRGRRGGAGAGEHWGELGIPGGVGAQRSRRGRRRRGVRGAPALDLKSSFERDGDAHRCARPRWHLCFLRRGRSSR